MIMKTKKEKLTMFSKQMSAKAKEAFSNPTRDNLLCLRSFFDIGYNWMRCAPGLLDLMNSSIIVLIVMISILMVLLEIAFRVIK